jgi:hypothetical protein
MPCAGGHDRRSGQVGEDRGRTSGGGHPASALVRLLVVPAEWKRLVRVLGHRLHLRRDPRRMIRGALDHCDHLIV